MKFGWIESKQLFNIVYAEDDGQLQIKYEVFPVTDAGDPILQNQKY